MKKISLSEVEVNDLLDLYQSEIDRSQRRINNLKNIIKKLSEGHSEHSIEEKPIKIETKRGRKPKIKSIETQLEKDITLEPKKRGRKPKFNVETIKAEPRKRGRKPKEKVADAQVTKAIVKKLVTKEPKNKISKTTTNLKKRGRKPKPVVAEVKPISVKKEAKVVKKDKKTKVQKKSLVKAKAEPKVSGRKPRILRKPIKGGKGKDKVKWNDFINDTITSKDSLMLASSITRAALEKFKIPASDRDRVRMAISTTLTKMANKDKILQTYIQPGIRGAFFGLAKWFNDKAELNNDYKKKLM
jgi:hypothetical protein